MNDLISGELVEDDDIIDTVEEFRAEVVLEFVLNLALHAIVICEVVICVSKTKSKRLRDIASTEVGSHDDDSVLKVNGATLRIG